MPALYDDRGPAACAAPLPCSTAKNRENLDFIPKIEQIAESDRLQIKDLREQFPTLANRELNRANREAK